jgi:putative SOS response-associated peptidase YedK
VILPSDRYAQWLQASPQDSLDFLRPYPAEQMVALGAATTPHSVN